MNVACPRCASLETLSLPLLQREGWTAIQSGARRVAVADFAGQPGVGSAAAAAPGYAQSLLARQLSPPRKKQVFGWLLLLAVAASFFVLASLADLGIATLVSAGIAGLGAWRVWANRAYNALAYPTQLRRWEQSLLCRRCGEVFVVW